MRNYFDTAHTVLRTSHLAKVAGYRDFAPTEDLELFLQLGRVGAFANLPDFSLAYRIHPGGESARKAKVAKKVLQVISYHQDAYPGAFRARIKMLLLIVLAKLGLK